MNIPAKDRRKLARIVLDRELLVFDLQASEKAGVLGNINVSGMMLISNRLVQPEQVYSFDLTLPEAIGGKATLSLQADCLWAGAGDEDGQYIAGFQFVNISDTDRERVAQLIAAHKQSVAA